LVRRIGADGKQIEGRRSDQVDEAMRLEAHMNRPVDAQRMY
jgi:hypothetical protein